MALAFSRGRSKFRISLILISVITCIFAIFLGLITSLFPASFVAKLGFIILAMVILISAFFLSRWGSANPWDESFGRRTIFLWLFLLGAFPWYIPFKFGPLPGLNPVRLSFIALFFFLTISLFTSSDIRSRLQQRFRNSRVTFIIFALLILWMFISAIFSPNLFWSLDYVAKIWLHGTIIFLASIVFLRNFQDIVSALRALALGGVIASIAGIVEWRLQSNIFAQFFPSDPDALSGLEWILTDRSRLGNYRVSGTQAHPLALAEYLAAVLPGAAYLAIADFRSSWRWTARLSLPLMLVAIYLTHTRTGVVAGAFALVLTLFGVAWMWTNNSQRSLGRALSGWFAIIIAIALTIGVAMTAAVLLEGRNRIEASSTNARVQMLKGTELLVEESPLIGHGPGLAAITLGHRSWSGVLTIDSYYMTVAIEAGLVGLIGFLALSSTPFLRLFRFRSPYQDEYWLLGVVMASSIFGMLVMKIGLSLMHNFDLMFWLLAASVVWGSLSLRSISVSSAASGRHRTPINRVSRQVITVAGGDPRAR